MGWLFIASCQKLLPPAPDDNELLDGPLPGLTEAQHRQFLKGDVAFNDEVFTDATGLGPLFVATSCGSCHAGDGKGHPFTTLARFGQTDSTGNNFLHLGGPQLQNRALPGHTPEVIPVGAPFAKFLPPANTGLGFFELVADADILAMAEANKNNADGVRGKPNWNNIPAYVSPQPNAISQNGKFICRFGKKGSVYNLLQQTANAYNQDMGIASVYEPKDTYTGSDIDPEVSTQTVLDVVFYLQTLKAPLPRNQNDAQVVAGKQQFINLGCEVCHKQTLKTGYSPVASLSNQIFHPYTDLLLHDMGPQLNDGYTEGGAAPSEWRTPALWGLGLSPNSQGGSYFLMHDGRATTIEAAILLHGGEANASRMRYEAATSDQKNALIKFLESL